MKSNVKHLLERSFRSVRRDVSIDTLVSSCLPYFEAVNTPISLGVYLRLKYHEFDSYIELELDPLWYTDARVFEHDYQCVKLFSKYENLPLSNDKKRVAEKSFIKAEMECLHTNIRFSQRDHSFYKSGAVSSIAYRAMRKISQWLGECPCIEDIPLRFGPGNNVGLSKYTNVYDKFVGPLTLTGNLLPIASDVMATCPSFAHFRSKNVNGPSNTLRMEMQRVWGSKLGFVPKNAKTYRSICTEPVLNSFVQLGIGQVLRRRLRKVGCNLNSQERNQELARIASLRNDLATVDLSAASDTISFKVVQELLPQPWFELLHYARSPSYYYEGKVFSFEKFSSMGNGYTFELESLIFLALARSTCAEFGVSSKEVSVYGDDIIIPTEVYAVFRDVLEHFGFTLNQAKSFSSGPFRESCGKDWFFGFDVRPIYVKKEISNQYLFALINNLRRASDGFCHKMILARSLEKLLPPSFRKIRGPDGFGDGHLITDRKSVV